MKLDQLRTLQAVEAAGSFQGAARVLNKSHPAVIMAIKNLEAEYAVEMIERSRYRATLTVAGRSFLQKSNQVLKAVDDLNVHAGRLAGKFETELDVVIGDVTPKEKILSMLRRFFKNHPETRLNLHFEALSGPVEKLLSGKADLIFHIAPKSLTQLQIFDVMGVEIVPVVAPGFLQFSVHPDISWQDMQPYVQCFIRDSSESDVKQTLFMVENAPRMTVGDQMTKKEVILQGMAWGHMPDFLIEQELADGRLLDISGNILKTTTETISIIRRADASAGPVAESLWQDLTRPGTAEKG